MVRYTSIVAAVLLPCLCGCGQMSSVNSENDKPSPQQVVGEFLEAVRTGNEAVAARLLTRNAREKTEQMEMVVAPPGSETAKYTVHDVQFVAGVAHVASDWSDLDSDGLTHVDRIVWVLQQVDEGWRISGMTAKVFADAEPIVLNFEDPADMLRKQQQAEEEIARRHQQAAPAGERSTNSMQPAIR